MIMIMIMLIFKFRNARSSIDSYSNTIVEPPPFLSNNHAVQPPKKNLDEESGNFSTLIEKSYHNHLEFSPQVLLIK